MTAEATTDPVPSANRAWPTQVGLPAAALLALALAFRLPALDAFLNIDAGWQWFRRTAHFWAAIADGQWAETYQVHPGVTLMWLSGLALKAGPGLGGAVTPAMVAAGALPVALVSSLIAPGTFLLWRRLGPGLHGPALLAGALLATEPFLVGHGRTMHLDALLTTFAWLGVLLSLGALRTGRRQTALPAGVLLALAVLTKVAGGAVALGVGLVGLAGLVRPGRGRRFWVLVTLTSVALATTWVLWPALWVAPLDTLERLLAGVTGEVDRGHRVYFDGAYHAADPGPAYYLAVLQARVSPEVLVAAVVGVGVVAWPRGGHLSTGGRALGSAFLAYSILLGAQILAAKKIDRYVLPFFPLLCVAAGHGFWAVSERLRRAVQGRPTFGPRAVQWALALPLLGLLGPRITRLVALHPHPIAWAADWPGRPAGHAITLGFGEGLREAALWIAEDAGGQRVRLFSGMYRPCLEPWLASRESSMANAEYILRYISVVQRGFRAREYRLEMRGLLHEVVLDGRVYAEIHAGPAYRGPTHPGLSMPWPAPPKAMP